MINKKQGKKDSYNMLPSSVKILYEVKSFTRLKNLLSKLLKPTKGYDYSAFQYRGDPIDNTLTTSIKEDLEDPNSSWYKLFVRDKKYLKSKPDRVYVSIGNVGPLIVIYISIDYTTEQEGIVEYNKYGNYTITHIAIQMIKSDFKHSQPNDRYEIDILSPNGRSYKTVSIKCVGYEIFS